MLHISRSLDRPLLHGCVMNISRRSGLVAEIICLRDAVPQANKEMVQQNVNNALPITEEASDPLNKGAADMAANGNEKTKKLSAVASDTEQEVADNVVPKTDELTVYQVQVLSFLFHFWRVAAPGFVQDSIPRFRCVNAPQSLVMSLQLQTVRAHGGSWLVV